MTERTASCRCGQLRVTLDGDPVRISVCHCLACQKRTGSVFSAQVRWPAECAVFEGESKQWTRTADSGQRTTYHFCPECGSTVFYELASVPDVYAVPLGAFADPTFPAPRVSVYESSRHPWVAVPEGAEHVG